MACLPVASMADIFEAGGTTYQYVTLSEPGMTNTLGFGINNLGEITGYAYNNAGDTGFTYSAGQFQTQSVAGYDSTDIYGVNDAGTLVGSYYDLPPVPTVVNALEVVNGAQQLPGLAQSEYYALNNNGAIVGTTYTSTAGGVLATGFFLNGANSSTVSYPNAAGTYPHGLNDSDAIVGFIYESGPGTYSAFLTTPGCQLATCFTLIGLPGAYSSFAYGINDSGTVVGNSVDTNGISQGFLYSGSTYTAIDIPGAVDTYLTAINNQGELVGYYQDQVNGPVMTFAASAVPEPVLSGLEAAVFVMLVGIKIRAHRRSLAKL